MGLVTTVTGVLCTVVTYEVVAAVLVIAVLVVTVQAWGALDRRADFPFVPATDTDHAALKKGVSTKRLNEIEAGSLDAIVIGSGIGGLTCAAALARVGRRVLVLEQHDVVGGCTHTFEDRGYEFDVGLHYVGGKIWDKRNACRMLLDRLSTGRQVHWAKLDTVFDVAIQGGQRFDVTTTLKADLMAKFPDETTAIEAYFEAVRQEQAAAGPFFVGMLLSCLLPTALGGWVWSKLGSQHMKISDETVATALGRLTSNAELRGLLAYHYGNYGLPPSEASFAIHGMVANHYFDGAAYPVGGCAEIAEALVPTITAAGGDILVRARVDEVVVEDGVAVGVRMAKTARVIRAPLIISACGARTTHTSLIPVAHRLPLAVAAFAPPDGVGQPPLVSTAHFVLFVALDTDGAELPSRNYWVTPTPDHDANVRAHRKDDSAEFPAVFVSFPSRKDPDYQRRYPGKSTASIIAAADYDPFKEWSAERVKKRGAEYEALKHNVATRMLAHLFELHPELENKVDFWELGTPLSTQYYIGAATGESYGLAATPDRFHQNAVTSVQTGVPGLLQAGGDVISAGVMGAQVGGLFAAVVAAPRAVLWDNLSVLLRL